jgi:methylglutaconyl-CoA hydratase
MSSPVVLVEKRCSTSIISINRPDRRNALNREVVGALIKAFQQDVTSSSRCVILTGQGTAFCAGMDLVELSATLDQAGEAEQVQADAGRLAQLLELIFTLSKPTIAVLNGPAVAGGAGLMTVCDLAIADPAAKIGYPEVKRGLVAAMVMPHLLRLVGERGARELLLTGKLIDAHEALRIGLINAVASPPQSALDLALAWASELTECAPKAVSVTKRLLWECSSGSIAPAGLTRESAQARLHIEAKEGLRAFLEKRPIPWLAKD